MIILQRHCNIFFCYTTLTITLKKTVEGEKMTNEQARKQVKLLKAMQNISYKEIASYIEIKDNSLYNWLRCQYNLSKEKLETLEGVICNLKE